MMRASRHFGFLDSQNRIQSEMTAGISIRRPRSTDARLRTVTLIVLVKGRGDPERLDDRGPKTHARAAARLEMERRAKAEEERKQKEAELKKRLAEEKLLQEQTARKKAAEEKRLAEEEKQRQEQEELSKQKRLEEEQSKREDDELELRKMLNLSTRSDDWRVARSNLHVRCT